MASHRHARQRLQACCSAVQCQVAFGNALACVVVRETLCLSAERWQAAHGREWAHKAVHVSMQQHEQSVSAPASMTVRGRSQVRLLTGSCYGCMAQPACARA